MVRYRRAKVAGGCYFLTLALQDRRSDLLFKSAALLRRCLQNTQVRLHFRVPALVVLPTVVTVLSSVQYTNLCCSLSYQSLPVIPLMAGTLPVYTLLWPTAV